MFSKINEFQVNNFENAFRLIILKMQTAVIFVPWIINRWDWHSSFLFLYFSSPPRTQELPSHFIAVMFFPSISFLTMPVNTGSKAKYKNAVKKLQNIFLLFFVNLLRNTRTSKTLHRMVFWQMWEFFFVSEMLSTNYVVLPLSKTGFSNFWNRYYSVFRGGHLVIFPRRHKILPNKSLFIHTLRWCLFVVA